MKKCFKYLSLFLVIILVLSGCGKGKQEDASSMRVRQLRPSIKAES